MGGLSGWKGVMLLVCVGFFGNPRWETVYCIGYDVMKGMNALCVF